MATGDAFEKEVEQYLNDEVQRGTFGFDPAQVKVFRKKGYYSQGRLVFQRRFLR